MIGEFNATESASILRWVSHLFRVMCKPANGCQLQIWRPAHGLFFDLSQIESFYFND